MTRIKITLLLSLLLTASAVAENLYVEVKATQIRSAPKYWASAVAGARYGDALTKINEAEGWYEVKTKSGAKGFIHGSAVTPRKIVFSSSGATAEASSADIVLAGKGFNKEVEGEFAAQNSSLDFAAVNTVESLRVPESAVAEFMKSGKLVR